jgi:hypothetical protein
MLQDPESWSNPVVIFSSEVENGLKFYKTYFNILNLPHFFNRFNNDIGCRKLWNAWTALASVQMRSVRFFS